jgi:hypothetical protein
MFVRVKKIGRYEYLYLVENAREGGRHVQRVIKQLGRRDELETSDLLDGLKTPLIFYSIAKSVLNTGRVPMSSSYFAISGANLWAGMLGIRS